MARKRKIFAPRESLIQQAVVTHWRTFGLPDTLVAAIPNARAAGQAGLTRGLFDLLVIAPKLGAAFIELKTESGRLSPNQKAFKLALIRAGVTYAVCRGRDEPIRVLEDWNVVRRQVQAVHCPATSGVARLGGAGRGHARHGAAKQGKDIAA
jgi:hypothetical protein